MMCAGQISTVCNGAIPNIIVGEGFGLTLILMAMTPRSANLQAVA